MSTQRAQRGPISSAGKPWAGELLTCAACGVQHPDRDDVADDGRCPKATGKRWWHDWTGYRGRA